MTTYTYAYKRKGMAGTHYARKAYPRRRNSSYNKRKNDCFLLDAGVDLTASILTGIFKAMTK